MELQGKIFKVFAPQSGMSKTSSKPWMVQQAVIEIPGKFPKKMAFEIFGEERIRQADIHEGEDVNILFDIDAHDFNGRWYNQVRAFSVVKLNAQQPQQKQIPTQPVPITPQLFNEPIADVSDGLPF